MSQRSHYGNPVGAPHSVTIPHKYQDPYRYPPRLHRTGDSALSSRMSSDVPPAWGPEMQDTYPILKWKQDVTTWSLATRTSEDKKGFLFIFNFKESQNPMWRIGFKIQRSRYGEPDDYKTETKDTEAMSAGKRCEERLKKA